MSTDKERPDIRTPVELIIKTITTHAFALGSYAYLATVLRRPARSHIHVLRLLFFLFVPTLPLVEFAISLLRSILQFCRNYEDSDETHSYYYLSGALGQHVQLAQDSTDDKERKDSSTNIHLLNVGNGFVEKRVLPIDWGWFGKLLAALFGMTQAIGTIIMWARRMKNADAFSFDHRNGAMGIASTSCNAICILALVLRLDWKISKSYQAKEGDNGTWLRMTQANQLIVEAILSMLLHLTIAVMADEENMWLYTSAGCIALPITSQHGVSGFFLFQVAQSAILIIFIVIFRHELMRRIGIKRETFDQFFKGRKAKRVKTLLAALLVLWMITDILLLFVVDILQVVRDYPYSEDGGERGGHYWEQDPLSDSLVVI